MNVMSRSLQHELGIFTLEAGWEGALRISERAVRELRF